MDASTHGSYGMGAVVHWWSRQIASVCTVLIFVHSFDGVRHAGCVGVWSGALARRRYDALPSLSPDAVFFPRSARPRTDAPLTKTDRGNAAQTQREQRLAGAYQGWLVMRGCTRAQKCVQQKRHPCRRTPPAWVGMARRRRKHSRRPTPGWANTLHSHTHTRR